MTSISDPDSDEQKGEIEAFSQDQLARVFAEAALESVLKETRTENPAPEMRTAGGRPADSRTFTRDVGGTTSYGNFTPTRPPAQN